MHSQKDVEQFGQHHAGGSPNAAAFVRDVRRMKDQSTAFNLVISNAVRFGQLDNSGFEQVRDFDWVGLEVRPALGERNARRYIEIAGVDIHGCQLSAKLEAGR